MAYGQQGSGSREHAPGQQLARMLRRWWEEAGHAPGGTRPTQQALAARLGVDQTTLSRYLNPKHTLNAPPRVVEALHSQLRAPAADLPRARELCRAALEESNRQRSPGGRRTSTAGSGTGKAPDVTGPGTTGGPDPADTPATGTVTEPATATATATGTGPEPGTADAADGTPGRPRPRGALLTLMVAALVLAFAAGAGVHKLIAPDREISAVGAAGAVASDEEPPQWPVLRMKSEDQYTHGRALQHLLNSHGHKVRADGFFGAKTRDAVMAFQRSRHLSPDGKVGEDTWPELVRPAGPGDSGPHVLALQELLDNVGLGGTVVSGRFTPVTTADLRFFQKSCRLPATGRADTETWLYLLAKQLRPVSAPAYQTATSGPGSGSAPTAA
ncbi:peptidoglycan-binding protein [Streptomyces sp. NPDC006367]|uniref:peptidoglycan-binding protein n=1 Tax=unclassified Streptomyces TaxID=2593676 RepID=UPI0033A78F8D